MVSLNNGFIVIPLKGRSVLELLFSFICSSTFQIECCNFNPFILVHKWCACRKKDPFCTWKKEKPKRGWFSYFFICAPNLYGEIPYFLLRIISCGNIRQPRRAWCSLHLAHSEPSEWVLSRSERDPEGEWRRGGGRMPGSSPQSAGLFYLKDL